MNGKYIIPHMPFVNNQLAPSFGAFAWLSLSTVIGLDYAKSHGMTGIWILVPITVTAAVLFIGFVVLCALSIPFLDRYGRPKRGADEERGGRGAG